MRCWLILVALLVLVGLTGSSLLAAPADPAKAAEGKGEHKDDKHKDDHKGEKEGIDLFRGALDLSIWTIVIFLVLFFVLSKYAWGPILQGMEAREKNIHQAVLDAQAARTEATNVRQELQAQIARANDEARQIRDQARKAAEKSAADEIARVKAELQAEKERLHREVETERDQALHSILQQAATLATLISAKAIGRSLNDDDHRRLLDEALREIRPAAQDRTHILQVRA